jgi:TetR/AcrR family transcriptional regulator, mexJK operon transcriptional repressor
MNHVALDLTQPESEVSPKHRQMLEAAAELFGAHGYGSVSMDAVARTAGVSKATLYAHFASKERLFATMVGEQCRRNTAGEEMFPQQVEDVVQVLRAIGRRGLRFLLQDRTLAIYRMVLSESSRFPELGAAFMENGPQRFRDRLAQWLAAQTAAGRLAAGDGGIAAEHFLALIKSGVFMRATLGQPPVPDDAEIASTVDAAVDTFVKAFGPAR